MKTSFTHFSALSLLLLLSSCSKKPVEVTGQIFVITQGRDNIKMGGVEVLVVPDEEFRKNAKEVVTWMQQEAKAEAQRRVDSDHMTDFINEVIELEKTSPLKIPELPKIRESIVKDSDFASEFTKSLMVGGLQRGSLIKMFGGDAEKMVFTTDADGRFTLPLKGKAWFHAMAERKVGDNTEGYIWLKGFEAPDSVSKASLVISNDDDINDEDELYLMLAGACEVQGQLENFRKVEVSENMKSLVGRYREEVESAKAKAEKDAAEAKVKAEKDEAAPLEVEGEFIGVEQGDYYHWNIKTKEGDERSFFVLNSDVDIEKVLENPEPYVGKACRVTWKKSIEEIPEAGGKMELEQVLAVEWLKVPGSR